MEISGVMGFLKYQPMMTNLQKSTYHFLSHSEVAHFTQRVAAAPQLTFNQINSSVMRSLQLSALNHLFIFTKTHPYLMSWRFVTPLVTSDDLH